MRWLALVLIILLSGFSIQAIDFAEGDNHPDYFTDDIFDDPETFGEDFFGNQWNLFVDQETNFEHILSWYDETGAVITLIEMDFVTPRIRNTFRHTIVDQFDVVFQNYSPYSVEASCRLQDVMLYEIDATFNGSDHLIRHYYWGNEGTTLWTIGYYFPAYEENRMLDYLEAFQPNLASCED